MHQIYIIKYCILLKTGLLEKEWVINRQKCGFHNDIFQVLKKSLANVVWGCVEILPRQ